MQERRVTIRPKPFRSFRGRTYVDAVSPESAPIVARLGLGVLIIPQKPWEMTVKELGAYRAHYREYNGCDAPPPIVASFVACHTGRSPPTSPATASIASCLQLYGTPEQVYERIREYQRLAGSDTVIGIFSYGGMPHDDTRRNMKLFAERVLARLKADAS